MDLAEFRSTLAADFARTPWRPDRLVIFIWRLGQYSSAAKVRRIVPFVLWNLLDRVYVQAIIGAELPASAVCGPGLFLRHRGRGVVIHPAAVIGSGLTLFHRVTIGETEIGLVPVLGDDVFLGVGCTVLGPVTLGDGVKVGAGAVVVKDAPAGATVVGVPGRVVAAATIS